MGGAAIDIRGFRLWQGWLDRPAQEALVAALRAVAQAAPLVQPVTPGGRPMSVRMTAAGRLGWVTDRRGYRYESRQPSGAAWPPIPPAVLRIWRQATGLDRDPDCCLVNSYGEGARMGLHQDRDEADLSQPIVSVSLGLPALFLFGGPTRGGRPLRRPLVHGDVVVWGGPARLHFHGIAPLAEGSHPATGNCRVNLTFRRAA